MSEAVYDEVEIEDMDYDEDTETYYYPCPCGDRFFITKEDLMDGEDLASCPSCSLIIRIIYDEDEFDDEDDDGEGAAVITSAAPVTIVTAKVVPAVPAADKEAGAAEGKSEADARAEKKDQAEEEEGGVEAVPTSPEAVEGGSQTQVPESTPAAAVVA